MNKLVIFIVALMVNLSGCASLSSFQSLIDDSLDGPMHGNLSKTYSSNEAKIILKASLDGKMITDEEKSEIVSFPKRSDFEISIFYPDNTNSQLIISRGNNELVTYEYRENGIQQTEQELANQFLKVWLPSVYRETGFDYKKRISYFTERCGNDCLFDEVQLISSDMVTGLYLREILHSQTLSEDHILQALLISKTIESDFDMANFFEQVIASPASEKAILELINIAMSEISSSAELSRTLSNVIENRAMTQLLYDAILTATSSINSQSEREKIRILLQKE